MSTESWISIKLFVPEDGKGTFEVLKAKLESGKFTTHGSDHETDESISQVNDKVFKSGSGNHRWVDASTRTPLGVEGFGAGTEGSFQIWNHVKIGNPSLSLPTSVHHKIVEVSWKIPSSILGKHGWSDEEPEITVKTFREDEYEVKVKGLTPEESTDESEGNERMWSTQISGSISVRKW